MQRKYLGFLSIHTVKKKGKGEEQCIQSSLKGCQEERLFKVTRPSFFGGVPS